MSEYNKHRGTSESIRFELLIFYRRIIIFSVQILGLQDLAPPRKKPFVRFLLWVYMNTGGDKLQTGSIILFHDGYVSFPLHCISCCAIGKSGPSWSTSEYCWMGLSEP